MYNRQVTKLSLSLRVLDEQQVERHYKGTDLTELYKLKKLEDKSLPTEGLKDELLANLLTTHRKYVFNVFEHESLLKNQVREARDCGEILERSLTRGPYLNCRRTSNSTSKRDSRPGTTTNTKSTIQRQKPSPLQRSNPHVNLRVHRIIAIQKGDQQSCVSSAISQDCNSRRQQHCSSPDCPDRDRKAPLRGDQSNWVDWIDDRRPAKQYT